MFCEGETELRTGARLVGNPTSRPAGNSKQLTGMMTSSQHLYAVRPCKDKRGVDLISDALPFSRLWYGEANAAINAVSYARFCKSLA